MGFLVLVALVVTATAGWRWVTGNRPHSEAAMRVLPEVVGRAGAMAHQRGPVPIAPPAALDHSGSVRILGPGTVRPLPWDAPAPRRPRRRPRPRSMTPRAVAARRARARRRASQALGMSLPEPDRTRPAPISLPRPPAPVVSTPTTVRVAPLPVTMSAEPAAPVRRRRPLVSAPLVRDTRPWVRWGRQPSVLAAAVVVNLLVAVAVMGADHPTASPRSVAAVHVRSRDGSHRKDAARPPVGPLTQGPNGPELQVRPGSTIVLSVTDRAWVRVTRQDTGADVVDGTLQPGGRIEVPVATPLDLRTGAVDALQVSVDGTRAELPPGPGVADVQVVPES